MLKWEYMSAWVDKDWKVKSIVGPKSDDFAQRIRFVEFLNQAGQMGWELINVLPVEVGNRAFLKRPSKNGQNSEPIPKDDYEQEDIFELEEEDFE